jgi:dTDP-4-dehydrorhamnose reductase
MDLYRSIIITGSGGMLALALKNVLESRKLSYTAFDRKSLDVTSEESLKTMFAEHKPTLLINCAAHTKVDLCEDEKEKADAINGHAVGHIAKLSQECGTTLVHYSTDFVFNGSGTRPYRIGDPVEPLSAYGSSKLLGEQKLQASPPEHWLILRTAWLYGRGGPNFPRTIVERARQGGALKVVNDQIGSPTYTEDLSQATFDLLDHNAHGLFHVTNTGSTSWHGFAQAAVDEFGMPVTVGETTSAEWLKIRPKQAHRPAYSVLDGSALEKAIRRPMRPWREGLKAFRDAVNANGFM